MTMINPSSSKNGKFLWTKLKSNLQSFEQENMLLKNQLLTKEVELNKITEQLSTVNHDLELKLQQIQIFERERNELNMEMNKLNSYVQMSALNSVQIKEQYETIYSNQLKENELLIINLRQECEQKEILINDFRNSLPVVIQRKYKECEMLKDQIEIIEMKYRNKQCEQDKLNDVIKNILYEKIQVEEQFKKIMQNYENSVVSHERMQNLYLKDLRALDESRIAAYNETESLKCTIQQLRIELTDMDKVLEQKKNMEIELKSQIIVLNEQNENLKKQNEQNLYEITSLQQEFNMLKSLLNYKKNSTENDELNLPGTQIVDIMKSVVTENIQKIKDKYTDSDGKLKKNMMNESKNEFNILNGKDQEPLQQISKRRVYHCYNYYPHPHQCHGGKCRCHFQYHHAQHCRFYNHRCQYKHTELLEDTSKSKSELSVHVVTYDYSNDDKSSITLKSTISKTISKTMNVSSMSPIEQLETNQCETNKIEQGSSCTIPLPPPPLDELAVRDSVNKLPLPDPPKELITPLKQNCKNLEMQSLTVFNKEAELTKTVRENMFEITKNQSQSVTTNSTKKLNVSINIENSWKKINNDQSHLTKCGSHVQHIKKLLEDKISSKLSDSSVVQKLFDDNKRVSSKKFIFNDHS